MCASCRPSWAAASARACARSSRWCWRCSRRARCRRSVRVVLTRQQMYALGYRPAMIQRIAIGANAGGTLDAITHDAVTVTSQYEDFYRQETGWSGLLYKCANAQVRAQARASSISPTSCDMRAPSAATAVYALESRDGRAGGRAQARSARASPALLFGSRPARRPALQQQGAARMLPPGRRGLRLGQAQPRAALDARRQRAGRLGHGDRRLGSACRCRSRCASRSPPTAMPRSRARPPTSAPAPTPSWRRSRPTCSGLPLDNISVKLGDSSLAAIAGRRRIMDRGLGLERHRDDGRRDPRRAAAPGQADAEFAAGRRRRPTRSRSRTASW